MIDSGAHRLLNDQNFWWKIAEATPRAILLRIRKRKMRRIIKNCTQGAFGIWWYGWNCTTLLYLDLPFCVYPLSPGKKRHQKAYIFLINILEDPGITLPEFTHMTGWKNPSWMKMYGPYWKWWVFQPVMLVFQGLPHNIAPENGWLEYDPFLLGWPIFRGHVSFRPFEDVFPIENCDFPMSC